ncbi:G2/mitotic-specific cyclin 3 [Byssothecium circinans]|uniref:G2/mitotic-specific cyclin 3 n=1 Tax=Byssothecium circinans TaxID=147558 RepID=A0A6A5TCN4_9PLEO|nr:G2/mitotic-specific cyclin 3 [Byssothecium circinans]
MDAKPQRPLRALRVRDENVQPQLLLNKTIHQRNKSTPVLSMTSQQPQKVNPNKRQAFADVSNVARMGLVKDDMLAAAKAKENIISKDPAIVSAKEPAKPTALLRPAQRPLTHAASTANISAGPHAPATKKIALDATSQPTHKAITKKATTVFREAPSEPATNSTVAPLTSRAPSNVDVRPSQVAQAAGYKSTVYENVQSKVLKEQVYQVLSKPDIVAKIALDSNITSNLIEAQPTYEYVDTLEEKARAIEQERNDELAKTSTLNGGDGEEYWDEDEEEEYFDADGYTTARSLRSARDNTTGGVTLVLAPRITAKSKRELEAAKLWVEAHMNADDVEDELWDTSMVAEYGEEIFEYMHTLEEKMKPNASYMDLQAEIQWSMRSVLMDWLVQVHNRFTLLPETLFLAVNYVDRFLSAKVVSLGKLQLVGATALFLAAKYEEINCPSVQEIVYMVDGAYTVDEVLKAERFMLSMLQFELGWPGPMSFLRRVSKADDYDVETRTLAKYFLEITIMDERFVGCVPSFLAAAAHCLARFMLKKGDWSQAHIHYSGYTLAQLRQLLSVMLECCESPQKHHAAVFDKYTDKRYKRASVYVETEISRGFQLPFGSRDSFASQGQIWKRK